MIDQSITVVDTEAQVAFPTALVDEINERIDVGPA